MGGASGDAATAVLAEIPSRTVTGRASITPAIDVCPFLIASTGDWRLNAPTTDHRCSAFVPLTPLSLEKQARLCLRAEHSSCATYGASVEARGARVGAGEPQDRIGRWGLTRTAPLIEDTGGLRGTLMTMIADRRTWPAIPAVLLVATLLAVGISGIRAEGQIAATSTPTPAPTLVPTLAPSVAPTLAPTLAPTVAPSLAPTPVPTLAPTAAPSYRTYTVQSGDTLSSIASKYGTTTKVLQDLNNISDPRKLHIGQVLKVPPA